MKYEAKIFRVFLLLIMIALFVMPLNNALAANDGRIRVGIAVYEDANLGLSRENARLITDILTDHLIGVPNMALYERSSFEAIVNEIRRGGALIINRETAAQIGKATGVEYIIISSLSRTKADEKVKKDEGEKEWVRTGNRSGYYRQIRYPDSNLDEIRLDVEYSVNVRMIQLETGEVRFSNSEKGSARSGGHQGGLFNLWKDIYRRDYNRQQVEESLRSKIIEGVTTKVAEKTKNDLIKMTRFDPALVNQTLNQLTQPQHQHQTQQIQSQQPASTLENKLTAPDKVIETYPLDSGAKNMRIIRHNGAQTLLNSSQKNTNQRNADWRQAYDAYVELVGSYNGDYLAAFQAGEAARKLGDKGNALTWYDRALLINPNYEPAQRAKMLIQ